MLWMLLVGCAKVEEAPATVDDLLHWFWTQYETATDDEVRTRAAELDTLTAEPLRGTYSDLTDEEQATVTMDEPIDPADARGIFIAGDVACTFDDLEQVRIALDQKGLYEAANGGEAYIAYDRAYTSDLAAYPGVPLTWDTTYTVKPVLSEYTLFVHGGARLVPEADGVGPVFLSRVWAPAPATFRDDNSNDYFRQDYQIDVNLPRGDATVHLYGTWRDLSSLGFTLEEQGTVNTLLDGYEDYDRDTEAVCANGGF